MADEQPEDKSRFAVLEQCISFASGKGCGPKSLMFYTLYARIEILFRIVDALAEMLDHFGYTEEERLFVSQGVEEWVELAVGLNAPDEFFIPGGAFHLTELFDKKLKL